MSNWKLLLKKSPFGRALLLPYRWWYATRYFARPYSRVIPWLFRSRELANFTYDLTPLSIETMATVVSDTAGVPFDSVMDYARELQSDQELRERIAKWTQQGPEAAVSDCVFRPAKRMLYYLLVRSLKPALIVEAGVDKGLGSCVIAAALLRNREEGHMGRLIAADISPDAGYLLQSPYTEVATLVVGDAQHTFRNLDASLDLLIQDTAPQFEGMLLEAARHCLSPNATILSVWHTGELMRFARETGRQFTVFRDEPQNHWYPGSFLAIAFRPRC